MDARLKKEIHTNYLKLYKDANRDVTDANVIIELDEDFQKTSRDECRNVSKKVRTQIRNMGFFIAKTFKEMYKGKMNENKILKFMNVNMQLCEEEKDVIFQSFQNSTFLKTIKTTPIEEITTLYVRCVKGVSTCKLKESVKATEDQVKAFEKLDTECFRKFLRNQTPVIDYNESSLIANYSSSGTANIKKK